MKYDLSFDENLENSFENISTQNLNNEFSMNEYEAEYNKSLDDSFQLNNI